MPAPSRSAAARAGFSLVELLVAMTLTTLIMLAVIGLIGQSSTVYQDSRAAVSSLADARALLQFIESEFSSRLPRSPVLWQTDAAGNDQLGYIRAGSFDEQLLATQGDLATAVYYVAFTSDKPGVVSPKLFRHHLDAKETQALMDNPPPPPMPAVDPEADEPLLHNVIRFAAKPKQLGPAGTYVDWTPTSGGHPDAIELAIEMTDDASAARLASESAWRALRNVGAGDNERIVRRFSRTILLTP